MPPSMKNCPLVWRKLEACMSVGRRQKREVRRKHCCLFTVAVPLPSFLFHFVSDGRK